MLLNHTLVTFSTALEIDRLDICNTNQGWVKWLLQVMSMVLSCLCSTWRLLWTKTGLPKL